MTSLGGIGVLITRPDHQSGELAALVEKAGGIPVLLPTIDIRPTGDDSEKLAELRSAGDIDVAIFVSSNAVNYGQALLEELGANKVRLACVGPSTARCMKHLGHPPDLVPAQGFNSEALLSEPDLRDMTGKSVVIVRGEGGRELLGQSLRQRDGTVTYIETYRRVCPQPATGEIMNIESRWDSGGISVVTIYSVTALENLMAMLSDDGQRLLRESQIVTISDRIAKKARQLGIAQPALIASAPDDHAVVEMMLASMG